MVAGIPADTPSKVIPSSDLHPLPYNDFLNEGTQSLKRYPQEADYIHREHLYEIWRVRHRKLKIGAACIGILAAGGGLPFVTVWWQNKKAGRPALGPNPEQVYIAEA